jgi:DNA repair protein RAD16
MDRIHRLGQRRPVQAIKLVIEDSIESRIVQLQEKKSAMVDATLSADDSVCFFMDFQVEMSAD